MSARSIGMWPGLQTLLEGILSENRQVDDYEIETESKEREEQKLRVSAPRFYENTRGMQTTLVAVEVIPEG
jgi:hypothetical protein